MSFEIITTTDKAKRDQMFQDLRQNGNELERQAVKFSSTEPVLHEDGNQMFVEKQYWTPGAKHPKYQICNVFQSTWSVAYPRS